MVCSAVRIFDVQLEGERRRRRKRHHAGLLDLEAQFRHAATSVDHFRPARSSEKNLPISVHTSVPPDRPFQLHADHAHQPVALIHRRDVVFGLRQAVRMADAIHQQRLDIRLQLAQRCVDSSTISFQASSGSSDSTAPAGLG